MKLTLLTLLATAALAQDMMTPPPAQLAEMKKLSFLVGEWKGGGSIQMGPEKREFEGTEMVQSKLGGVVLTIDGMHHAKGQPGTPLHNAFAVVSYDMRAKGYQFRAYTANGQALTAEARLRDGGLEWGFEHEDSLLHQARRERPVARNRRDVARWLRVAAVLRDAPYAPAVTCCGSG
jgi:hypothetical protein